MRPGTIKNALLATLPFQAIVAVWATVALIDWAQHLRPLYQWGWFGTYLVVWGVWASQLLLINKLSGLQKRWDEALEALGDRRGDGEIKWKTYQWHEPPKDGGDPKWKMSRMAESNQSSPPVKTPDRTLEEDEYQP